MKILFKNADILVRDEKFNVLSNAFLAVDGDKISYIGTEEPKDEFDEIKDMSGKLLMPGLINCHNHCPMVLLRGIGSDLPLQQWLFDTIFPIEDRLTDDEIKAGSYLALLEMIAGGTVSFSDMYGPQMNVEAVGESGMKANVTRPILSAEPNETPEQSYRMREAIEYYEKYNNTFNGRVLIDYCIHAEYTCDERTARALIDEMNAHNGNLHIHLSETKKEHDECILRHGKTPAEWFDSLGAFESSAFAAHCVWLSESDMELFRRKGVSVVHNPTSNMKLASGFAPVPKMLDTGINVALGTDGPSSNNNLDMFEEMHIASIIHNGYTLDATVMNADTVLKMATVNGAKVQRRENCGELKVGNKADIIAVSLDAPHMVPALDKKALLTYSAQSSDVVMTMVDGKILYENGEYKTLDKEKIYFEFNKAVEKLYK